MKPILNFENYAITLDGRIINNTTKKCKKPTDNHSVMGICMLIYTKTESDTENMCIDLLQKHTYQIR